MFTEELSGNMNRKRQEQLKARRKETQRNKISQANHTTVDNNNMNVSFKEPGPGSNTMASSQPSPDASSTHSSIPASTTFSSTSAILSIPFQKQGSANNNNTVTPIMEQVLQSRQARFQIQEQHNYATRIQAYFRAYRIHRNQKLNIQIGLDKRIADLRTVQSLVPPNVEYAPPPAMVTPLVTQLLFLMHSNSRKKKTSDTTTARTNHHLPIIKNTLTDTDMTLVIGVIQQALLPGLQLGVQNPHLHPLLPWLDTLQGRYRLVKLVRLGLVCMTCRRKQQDKNPKKNSHGRLGVVAPFLASSNQIHILILFFQHVLGMIDKSANHTTVNDNAVVSSFKDSGGTWKRVIDFCSSILFDPTLDITSLGIDEVTSLGTQPLLKTLQQDKANLQQREFPEMYQSMDLIRFTRCTLLYSSGSSPIPSNVETMREGSISQEDRQRYSIIVDFVLRAVQSQSHHPFLHVRMVTELWTIPLFTWKVVTKTLEIFLLPEKKDGIPFFIQCLDTVLQTHSTTLFREDRSLLHIFPTLDVPLNRCPSPSSVSLLATLAYLGQVCPHTNGTKILSSISVDALLLDCIPVGSFTSRQSSADWLCEGSQLTPIVLNPVILDQCKVLLSDRYVRSLFHCALFHAAVDSTKILMKKDKHDVEMEEEMAEISLTSASSLASKDATLPDRSTMGLFMTSEWAKKLTRGVASLFKNTDDETKREHGTKAGSGGLLDTSSVSRQLAKGTIRSTVSVISEPLEEEKDPGPIIPRQDFLFALCRAYGTIISRWGGLGGSQRLMSLCRSQSSQDKPNCSNVAFFTDSCEPCVMNLLNVLCFSTDIIMTLWALVQSDSRLVHEIHELARSNKNATPLLSFSIISSSVEGSNSSTLHFSSTKLAPVVLFMFASCFAHNLIIVDDMDLPLPRHQILRSILLFKRLVFRLCCKDTAIDHGKPNHLGVSFMANVLKCLRDLYDKSSRRPMCAPKLFTVDDILENEIKKCKTYEDYISLLNIPILRLVPYLVPFKRRLLLYNGLIASNRISIQGDPRSHDVRSGIIVNVNRARILEDGLATMNRLGRNLRQRIIVRYYSDAVAEVGFDAGGLFKEFWVDLCAIAFDPNFGLFRTTDGSSDPVMYPNASSKVIHGLERSLELFGFLGRLLGKALYEGITIQPQFAHFFLSFLRGDYNYLYMLPDLSTVDPVLYNNLMFLKTYDGDARDLSLTFTVVNTDFGDRQEIELVPNGGQIDVTNENKNRYIAMVAKYHIHDKMKEQSESFTRGLWDVIDKKWLLIFNEPELQVLISGAFDGTIDVDDLKAHTIYIGAFSELDPVIHRFWKVVYSMTPNQLRSLLRFVTSCARPPSLGFSNLEPKFTIQRVDGSDAMLPTASTCFNILKLPSYSSTKILREKLLLALGEGSVGFHLA